MPSVLALSFVVVDKRGGRCCMLCAHRVKVKKQQLETHMELQTGSKLGKEHVKAVFHAPAYLT